MDSHRIKEILRLDKDIDEWESCVEDVSDQIKESDYKFDEIVAAARGALRFARKISDNFGIQKVTIIRPEHYKIAGKPLKKVKIRQKIPRRALKGRVLFADDVSDSGDTQEKCYNYLLWKKHPVKYLTDRVYRIFSKKKYPDNYLLGKEVDDIKTATMHIKTGTIFTPDFYAKEVPKTTWINYPDETREVIRELIQQGFEDKEKRYCLDLVNDNYLDEEIETAYKFIHDKSDLTDFRNYLKSKAPAET